MTQYGFYVDAEVCTGCRTCQVACKDVNRLAVGEIFRRVDTYCTGSFPEVHMYNVSMSCNHCASPACVGACPTGAMYKDPETGLVLHNDGACIGCEACVNACPYDHPAFIESLGIVRKCDGCAGLRVQGEQPACVASCPMRAIEFGDIEELKVKHADKALADDFVVLPDPLETTPSSVFAVKECMYDGDYDWVLM